MNIISEKIGELTKAHIQYDVAAEKLRVGKADVREQERRTHLLRVKSKIATRLKILRDAQKIIDEPPFTPPTQT